MPETPKKSTDNIDIINSTENTELKSEISEPNSSDEALEETEGSQIDNARKRCSGIFEWVETFAIYFSIGIAVLVLFFRHCPVVGESMMNTLKNGDLLIVTSFCYTPENGDIIVCQSAQYGLKKPLVKRVIATSGQTVTIDYENWCVTVDGVELDEDYVLYREGRNMLMSDHLEDTFTVPEGMLFVMGDNRNNSKDSRSSEIGFIDERYVVGRVTLRLFPFSDITVF